jgi:hypothetical protein
MAGLVRCGTRASGAFSHTGQPFWKASTSFERRPGCSLHAHVVKVGLPCTTGIFCFDFESQTVKSPMRQRSCNHISFPFGSSTAATGLPRLVCLPG